MKKQEILNAIENLSYYKKFNNPKGLPLTKGSYLGTKCERYINLKETRCHKDNPNWITKFHKFLGLPLIAIGITNTPEGIRPIFIFEETKKETPKDFPEIGPTQIESILLQIILNLQNEIIEDISNRYHLTILEIQSLLMPIAAGSHKFHLTFDYNKPDAPIISGYQQKWESDNMASALMLAQYEAIEHFMQIFTK